MRGKNVALFVTLLSLPGVSAHAQDSPTAPTGLLAKALAEGKATLAPIGRPRGAPQTYGTTAVSYYRISSPEFLPYRSNITYTDAELGVSAFHRRPTAGGYDFLATAHLPSGALLTYFELDYCDTNVTEDVLAGLFGCDYKGENCVPLSGFLSSATSGGCGSVNTDLTPAAWTVDNLNNELIVVMSAFALDGTTSFAGAIIGYVLQVSPAPAVATFLDVPTGHPQFQFIEALVASGITAGCGGGNYCPNANLTRGQMAVFLAKALGLQFN